MMVIGIIALPCALMAMIFFLAIRRAYRSNLPIRPFLLYPLISSFILTSWFMIWGYHAICTSRSSTAPIGFIFIPIYSIAVAVAGILISWSCLYVAYFVIERFRRNPLKNISIAFLAVAIVILALTGNAVQNKIVRDRLLDTATSGADVDSLEKILADATSSGDFEILAKLAKNRNTPVDDLVRIYDFCKPSINEFNPPEYVVFFSLAQNPRTPPDILVTLAACRQSTIRYAVAINPSTPTEILCRLAEDPDKLVRTYAEPRLRSRGHTTSK